MTTSSNGFVPPVYPFDRLAPIEKLAGTHEGGVVDLSVGTPCDPPPPAVVAMLSESHAERGYPQGAGNARLLDAARAWLGRRFGVELARGDLAACIGTKEFVAGLPHWLRLRDPSKDTVLYPAVAYPTYEIGAILANARAVPVPRREDGSLDLDSVDKADIDRALCLWSNSPANPTGELEDLGELARWGREHEVLVVSDECYAEYTWKGAPQSVLCSGNDGVLALHSISKRSNCAGLRMGFYAGDTEIVHYLRELRRHAGFMVPGPIQAASAVAFDDDAHVALQAERYERRLRRMIEILDSIGVGAEMPGGGFYLWVKVPDAFAGNEDEGPEWAFTRYLAERAGMLVSPGEFYGKGGIGYVRIAVVQPDDQLELVAMRLLGQSAS